MLKKKTKVLLLIVSAVLVLLGAGFVFYTKVYSTKQAVIQFEDDIVKKDGLLLKDYCICDKNSKSYCLYWKEDDCNFDSELYEFNKDGSRYDNPEKIEMPDDIKCYSINSSQDGNRIYMTILKKNNDSSDDVRYYAAYAETADLHNLKADDIKLINQINKIGNNYIWSVDDNGDILYMTVENNTSQLNYAENKDGNYDIYVINNVHDGYTRGAALSPDGQTIILSMNFDGNNESVYNLFVMKKEYNSWGAPKLIKRINDGKNDKIFPKISSDGKELEFVSQTSYILGKYEHEDIKNNIYKTDLKQVLDKMEKENSNVTENNVENTHKYDTADFDLKVRNKGDMSEKKGIYYEIYVNAFADSDGDGYGDLNGVTEKLDYLKDLGVDGIWLMPINPSPSYHGYDVIDYYSINKNYGTEADFKNLLAEAHKRNIKVIMDMVINHTSILNPWFTQSAVNKESRYRNFYRWVSPDDTENMNLSDKSPWKSNVWSKDGDSYYYSIFYYGMPDLNYNNSDVRKEIKNVAKKWLDLGVDGFRLDGAMHIYGDNEFKKQEDKKLDYNIQWWNEFALACEEINPDVYLVGEIWNDDDVLPQYAQPMDSKFNFTFRNNMFSALKQGNALCSDNMNLSNKLQNIINQYGEYDKDYIDAVFADNHDLDRTMSVVDKKEQGRLIADIYLTLPGNPFIYYGEEIGMMGGGKDECKRMPFKWNEDDSLPCTDWYYKWTGKRYLINSSLPSLEVQMKDKDSMYSLYKNLISIRKSNSALSDGTYESVDVNNDSIMAYKRESDDETVYVLHNFSNSPVTVDLRDADGGNVIFNSNDGDTFSDGKVTLDKTSSIIIALDK